MKGDLKSCPGGIRRRTHKISASSSFVRVRVRVLACSELVCVGVYACKFVGGFNRRFVLGGFAGNARGFFSLPKEGCQIPALLFVSFFFE